MTKTCSWLRQNSKFQLWENNLVYMFEDITVALVHSEKKLPLQTYFSKMHHQETLLSSLDFNQRVITDYWLLTGLFRNEIRQFPLSSLNISEEIRDLTANDIGQTLGRYMGQWADIGQTLGRPWKTIRGQKLFNLLVVKSTYE